MIAPKCDVCLDRPAEIATIIINGIYCCDSCFCSIAPNLKTECLETLELVPHEIASA